MYKFNEDPNSKENAAKVVKKWTDIAFKTGVMTPEERNIVKNAARQLYINSGLTPPPLSKIIITPSPFTAKFATGAASWINYCKKHKVNASVGATRSTTYDATNKATYIATSNAIRNATDSATDSTTDIAIRNATYIATDSATDSTTDIATSNATYIATDIATSNAIRNATDIATSNAIRNATYIATDSATDVFVNKTSIETYSNNSYKNILGCIDAVLSLSGKEGLKCANNSWRMYQGGNFWAYTCAYIEYGRDYAKLSEKGLVSQEVYNKYQPWEDLAKYSGFRYMHEDFCIISDRPVKIRVDSLNRPHCEDGPYIEWSDGTGIYAFEGTLVPEKWIMDMDNVNPLDILKETDVEKRAIGCRMKGWDKMLDHLDHTIIDSEENNEHGDLISIKLPDLPNDGLFLKALCPRNGWIMEGVPHVSDIDNSPIKTVKAAQAWRVGLLEHEFNYPTMRT